MPTTNLDWKTKVKEKIMNKPLPEPFTVVITIEDSDHLRHTFSHPCIFFLEDYIYLDVTNHTSNSILLHIYVNNPLDKEEKFVTHRFIPNNETHTIMLNAFGRQESANGWDYTYSVDVIEHNGEINCDFGLQ